MSDEHIPGQPATTQMAAMESRSKPSGRGPDPAFMRRLRNDPDSPRGRQAQAFLGGICVVFIVALVSSPHLDRALHVALLAFVVAIPFLLEEVFWGSLKLPLRFHGPRFETFMSRAASMASFWLSGIGYAAAGAGFVAVVWHLWPLAAVVLVAGMIVVQILVVVLGAILLIRRTMQLSRFKKQQQMQKQAKNDAR